MAIIIKKTYTTIALLIVVQSAYARTPLPACEGKDWTKWTNCIKNETYPNGDIFIGKYLDGKINGQGTISYSNGDKYVGEFKNGKRNGLGTFTSANGLFVQEGIWVDNNFLRGEKITK